MNLFENIILDVILILVPLLICILYEGYKKIYGLKDTKICLDFCIVTSFYLVLTYNINNNDYPYLMISIPLFLAYLKDRKESAILISILSCINYYFTYNELVIITIIEYFIYYLFYLKCAKKSLLRNSIIIKLISFFICSILSNEFVINEEYIIKILIIIIPFLIVSFIIEDLLKKIREMHLFDLNQKKLNEEKNLRMSLFKITHEIKNPITVCKGYLDMFDTSNKEKSDKYINIINDEINRVLVLLEDFLSINKIKIEKDILDINMLLEELDNNFSPILKEKRINKEFIISKDELFIEADYNRLIQVLINVIKNSIEATNKNGLIKLYTEVNDQKINIIVEDNGIGMDSEVLSKISEPFYSTKQKGTGLGVYLSKQIVEAHHGSIKYISEVNKGTKTIITLPFKEILI